MATTEQIQRHNAALTAAESEIRRELELLVQELQGRIRRGDLTRESIVQAFSLFRVQVANALGAVDSVFRDTVRLYSEISAVEADLIESLADDIRGVMSRSAQSAVDQESSSVLEAVLLAGIIGTPPVVLLNSVLDRFERMSSRLSNAITDTAVNADAAFLLGLGNAAGIQRYTYVGPTDSITRPWCKRHSGKTYTVQEIQDLWANNSWGGKAPGDPMVVRGGYNCRHFWMPVDE
jgi:hypothetical protein